jgi:hypothetical protein
MNSQDSPLSISDIIRKKLKNIANKYTAWNLIFYQPKPN